MPADHTFETVEAFALHLQQLHRVRRKRVLDGRKSRAGRVGLSQAERREIYRKAGGRCHICGGQIEGHDWEADHVFAHSAGGVHALDNYLPAHSLCNNYRWHYGAEEFQWIMKLGVWLRTQIEKESTVGFDAGEKFRVHEQKRAQRRRAGSGRAPAA